MSEKATQNAMMLATDLELFSKACLKIRHEDGSLNPFVWNKAQHILHQTAERQLATQGTIRINLLKSRQMGGTTYINGRGYHKSIYSPGTRALILSHLQDATDGIFDMVETYHNNMPDGMAPTLGSCNAKELSFKHIGSKYNVGTAGSGEVGRSFTFNFFHGSEVAFWKDASKIAKGAMQAVSGTGGSEIWLESTANGMEWFYDRWQRTERGEMPGYINVFLPWFIMDKYQAQPPKSFAPTPEEIKLMDKYDLSYSQLFWRRMKIAELGSLADFKQEYPSEPREAFEGGLRTGRVYPMDEEEVVIDPFEIPDHWLIGYGLDYGWSPDPTAVITTAYNPQTDTLYWTGEYGANELTPNQHAANMHKMGLKGVPGVSDPFGGKQRGAEGNQMHESYVDAGLNLRHAERMGVLASCMEVQERLRTGRLKIFSNCARTLQEYRMYVFDKRGQPRDKDNHFMDAGRYATCSGIPHMKSRQALTTIKRAVRRNADPWLV